MGAQACVSNFRMRARFDTPHAVTTDARKGCAQAYLEMLMLSVFEMLGVHCWAKSCHKDSGITHNLTGLVPVSTLASSTVNSRKEHGIRTNGACIPGHFTLKAKRYAPVFCLSST